MPERNYPLTKKKRQQRKYRSQQELGVNSGTGLPEKQWRYIQEFMACGDRHAAGEKVGYSKSWVSTLWLQPNFLLALARAQRDHARRLRITADAVLAETSYIAFADPGDLVDSQDRLVPLKSLPKKTRQAISSVKVVRSTAPGRDGSPQPVEYIEYRFWSKNEALAQLGKHLGLFPNKIQLQSQSDVRHTHAHFDLDKILSEIPLEARLALLQAIEKQQSVPQLTEVVEPNSLPLIELQDEESDSSGMG